MSAAPEIIEKIRKLLRLSKGIANEHEAARAAEKVRELLEKHHLSLTDVELKEQSGAEFTAAIRRRVHAYHHELAQAVADLLDCITIELRFQIARRKRVSQFSFCGAAISAESARDLFLWLHDEIDRLAEKHPFKVMGAGMLNSYRYGCAVRVREEVGKLKKAATEASQKSNAIVHLGRAIAERTMQELHPQAKKKSQKVRVTSALAFEMGFEDGAKLDLSSRRLKKGAAAA